MNKKTLVSVCGIAGAVSVGALVGKQAHLIVADELEGAPIDPETAKATYQALTGEPPPPRRLSNDPNHPDYHPGYARVGLRINGEERHDVVWYDLDCMTFRTREQPTTSATSIEPYWRFAESRQQRRARERWEAKR